MFHISEKELNFKPTEFFALPFYSRRSLPSLFNCSQPTLLKKLANERFKSLITQPMYDVLIANYISHDDYDRNYLEVQRVLWCNFPNMKKPFLEDFDSVFELNTDSYSTKFIVHSGLLSNNLAYLIGRYDPTSSQKSIKKKFKHLIEHFNRERKITLIMWRDENLLPSIFPQFLISYI